MGEEVCWGVLVLVCSLSGRGGSSILTASVDGVGSTGPKSSGGASESSAGSVLSVDCGGGEISSKGSSVGSSAWLGCVAIARSVVSVLSDMTVTEPVNFYSKCLCVESKLVLAYIAPASRSLKHE